MITVVTVHHEEGPRGEGITVADVQEICRERGVKFATIKQKYNIPVARRDLDFWIDKGIETIIVELN